MAVVKDDHVVQALAANRTYNAFDISVLPGDRGVVMTSVIPIASTRLRVELEHARIILASGYCD